MSLRGNSRVRSAVGDVMQIEIWSDVVCPWCYIGKRRIEAALADFGHREEVEVVYRSFQLDPTAPRVPEQTVVQMLAQRYAGGDLDAAREMVASTESVAAEEGLTFHHGDAPQVNTIDAHRLLHLARESGRQGVLKEALLAAYFAGAANLADPDVLRAVAADAGLDADRVEEVLAGSAFADAVARDVSEAAALGATGVPFFVIDRRFAVSGAQPTELFARALRQAWESRDPAGAR